MGTRLQLHDILINILGTENAYYQPPESRKIKYPAIVYSRSNIENDFANDSVYIQSKKYDITVIDKNPDSDIVDKVSKLPRIRYVRHYIADGLNHDVFTLIY